MKILHRPLTLAFCLAVARADAAVVDFAVKPPDPETILALDSAGALYSVQAFHVGGSDPQDILVQRLNPDGTVAGSLTFGGSGWETPIAATTDSQGFLYVVGETSSRDFASWNGYSRTLSGERDVFLTKLRWGSGIVYSTYLGTPLIDLSPSVAVDSAGSAHVAWNNIAAFDGTWNGDAFVIRLSPDGGSAIYIRELAYSARDAANDVAIDALGRAHVVGATSSPAFPNLDGFQPAPGGALDAYLISLSPDGELLSAALLGGAGDDIATDVVLDAAGHTYIGGVTQSADFPVRMARQPALAGVHDAFIAKVRAGEGVIYSTFFGGAGWDLARTLALDARGGLYVVGDGQPEGFPLRRPIHAPGSGTHALVARFEPDGTLDHASLVHDGGITLGNGLVVDTQGTAYITSAWSHPGVFLKLLTSVREEQDGAAVAYQGEWMAAVLTGSSGGTVAVSSAAGASALLTFDGSGAAVIGRRGPGAGVALVSVDGGAPQRVELSAGGDERDVPVFKVAGLPAGRHSLRVEVGPPTTTGGAEVIIDAFEIVGVAAAPTPTPSPTPAVPVRIEDTSADLHYSGAWFTNTAAGVHSGGSAHLSGDAGQAVSLAFQGTGIRWIGLRDPWAGIARISVDGVLQATVDTYSPSEQRQVVLFARNDLAAGPHTLRIDVTGTHNPSAGGALVWVDAFDVTPGDGTSPTPTPTPMPGPEARAEQDTASYEGSWFGNDHAVHSGGRAVAGMDAGARATFTFDGTGVAWIGYSDEWSGIAHVFVDGTLRATVDTYASPQAARKRQFSVGGLSPGRHTLTIEVPQARSPASGGAWVWIDAFDVTP